MKKPKQILNKATSFFVIVSFLIQTVFPVSLSAQELLLPKPDQFISLSEAYSFPLLKGLKFSPQEPLKMEFIIDTGDEKVATQEEAGRLIRYFLAGLTIPQEHLWVNLSPYEEDRIIPEKLAETDLGKDLLSQDYLLKQLSSSLTYPESETGKDYWKEVYQEVYKIAKTTKVPVNTFNKIWITPDEAEVYENQNGNFALITKATLKALLEEDFFLLKNKLSQIQSQKKNFQETTIEKINKTASDIMRRRILPKINQDVNQGRNFANLRQIYHSLILATWFKKKFSESIYKHYIDQNKISGIDLEDKSVKEKIFQVYTQAFTKGLYNYIKTDTEPVSRKKIKRQYFSGGVTADLSTRLNTYVVHDKEILREVSSPFGARIEVIIQSGSPVATKEAIEKLLQKITDDYKENKKILERLIINRGYLSTKPLAKRKLSNFVSPMRTLMELIKRELLGDDISPHSFSKVLLFCLSIIKDNIEESRVAETFLSERTEKGYPRLFKKEEDLAVVDANLYGTLILIAEEIFAKIVKIAKSSQIKLNTNKLREKLKTIDFGTGDHFMLKEMGENINSILTTLEEIHSASPLTVEEIKSIIEEVITDPQKYSKAMEELLRKGDPKTILAVQEKLNSSISTWRAGLETDRVFDEAPQKEIISQLEKKIEFLNKVIENMKGEVNIPPNITHSSSRFEIKFDRPRYSLTVVIKGPYAGVKVDGYLTIYDLFTNKPIEGLIDLDAYHGFEITDKFLITWNRERKVTVYELSTRKPVKGLIGLDARWGFKVTNDYLVTEDADVINRNWVGHKVTVYRFRDGKPVEGLIGLDARWGVEVTDEFLITRNIERKVTVYELSTGKPIEGLINLDAYWGFEVTDKDLTVLSSRLIITVYDLSTRKPKPGFERLENCWDFQTAGDYLIVKHYPPYVGDKKECWVTVYNKLSEEGEPVKGLENLPIDANKSFKSTKEFLVIPYKEKVTVYRFREGKPVEGLIDLDASDFKVTDESLITWNRERKVTVYDFSTGKPVEGLIGLKVPHRLLIPGGRYFGIEKDIPGKIAVFPDCVVYNLYSGNSMDLSIVPEVPKEVTVTLENQAQVIMSISREGVSSPITIAQGVPSSSTPRDEYGGIALDGMDVGSGQGSSPVSLPVFKDLERLFEKSGGIGFKITWMGQTTLKDLGVITSPETSIKAPALP